MNILQTRNIKPSKNNIVAIIVTYFQDDDFDVRVKAISCQVDKVVIVDNSASELNKLKLLQLEAKYEAHVIYNDTNLGVASALNIGIKYVSENINTCAWCLTLDQDTLVFPNLVISLVEAYCDCPFKDEVGIVGSNYEEWTTGKILFTDKTENETWAEVSHLPTSGCLTSLSMFKIVGDFRDELFIDYIDTEYCLRIKYKGYRVIIVPKVCMRHPLGYYKKSKIYEFLCGRSMVSNYPSFRHYYWSRNGIKIALEYFRKDFIWAVGQIYYITVKRTISVILFEENKLIKIKNIIIGIYHAITDKSVEISKLK